MLATVQPMLQSHKKSPNPLPLAPQLRRSMTRRKARRKLRRRAIRERKRTQKGITPYSYSGIAVDYYIDEKRKRRKKNKKPRNNVRKMRKTNARSKRKKRYTIPSNRPQLISQQKKPVKEDSALNVVASNRCVVCSKVVYLTEKLEADKKLFHKACFRHVWVYYMRDYF